MPTQAGVGYSRAKDSFAAGAEAAQQAAARTGTQDLTLAIVFTTEPFDEAAVLSGIQSVIGQTPLIGCSTAGVIANGQTFDDAVAIALLKSDQLKISLALAENINGHAKDTGRQLAEAIAKQTDSSGGQHTVIMLIDAAQTLGIVGDVIDGAYEFLGASYRFIGGGSSDNLHFKKSLQFLNGKIYQDAVVAACISQASGQAIAVKHGWQPEGINMIVTKVEGKVIKEIDGMPALKVYLESLGQDPSAFDFANFYNFASAHPFGIPTGRGDYIIRDPLSANPDDQSINFISEVPQNSIIRIMNGSAETLLAASKAAAEQAKVSLQGKQPALVFAADCVSRRLFLGEQVQAELANISQIGDQNTPMIGFFSLGEVGVESAGSPAFYNKTCALYALGE